jgi:cell division initiation protein
MPIRPIDVRRKEFKNGFRGYDSNQVDDFLDAVADEFERNYTENQRMREEVSSLRDRLQQFEDLEGSIRAALVHAEQASNDLRRAATSEAEDIRQSAQREADFTIREAQTRSHQMLADTSARIERVQESYEALQQAKNSFTNDFRHLLKTYMDMMDNMEVASAREIEASLRERLDSESIAVVREAARQEERPPEERPPEDSDVGTTVGNEPDGERTDPGLTISGHEIVDSEEDHALTTDEADPEATRLLETEPATDEPVDELAGADVVPEQSEVQEEDPAPDAQATEVLRAEDMGPLAGEPEAEEAPPGEPEVEQSTAQDETLPDEASEPTVAEPEAANEIEREEPVLAEESSSQEFFDREEGEQRDNRIFRASRFLRRRE